MGVLNVTADSFSDGGRYLAAEDALAQGQRLIDEGADIVDVGGESSRPGADPVDPTEELRRVVPVIEALAPQVRVSIDTVKPEVARAAVAAGATLVNDVSASLAEVAAELDAGYVVMHRQGTPKTMQLAPRYDDVVAEVGAFLAERAEQAEALGIGEVWVDPGIGFGKTLAHNLTLLRHLDELVAMGRPVLVGTSRKGFLGRLVARSDTRALTRSDAPADPAPADPEPSPVGERLEASLATATWALAQGARMVRVHDVGPTVQAAKVVAA
jgi:dihydropteroate synthase